MITTTPSSYHARDLVLCDACRNAMIAASSHATCGRCGGKSFHRLVLRDEQDPAMPFRRDSAARASRRL